MAALKAIAGISSACKTIASATTADRRSRGPLLLSYGTEVNLYSCGTAVIG